jgi:hypothetical protein
MYWRIEKEGRSFVMAEANGLGVPHLIVNRAQVVSEGCSACGKGFASAHAGERALTALIGHENITYMFCAQCGDAIMGRVQADGVRQRYVWDWAVPLKGAPLQNGAAAKK